MHRSNRQARINQTRVGSGVRQTHKPLHDQRGCFREANRRPYLKVAATETCKVFSGRQAAVLIKFGKVS